MRKSNYDKRPVLHVRTKGVSAWQGWEAIGAQLRKAIVGKPDAVVCVDCYHGVWESDVLSALTEQLNPSHVFCTAQATLPKEQVNAMLKDHLTDDRVFGIMAHYRIEQFFDMERVAALRQEIALAHGVRLVFGVGAALLGYQKFAHVKKRVAIWLDPWSDYDNAGYQLIQSLMAIASGGVLGVGLGLGSPTTIPVYHTDFIFSVICEQFGMLFGSCVLLMYVAIIWRGTSIAMAARTRFHGLLAMGCTAMLGLQTFIIIGGVIKLIPLTGVTMPFVSYGGTSLVACLCLIGLIQGVSSVNEDDLARDADLADYGGGAA